MLPDAAISEIAIANQRATTPPRRITVAEPRLARSVRRHQEAIIEVVAAALALPEDGAAGRLAAAERPAAAQGVARPRPRGRGPAGAGA